MERTTGLTVGADPELFLVDGIDLKLVSAIGLIGGDKIDPRPMSKPGYFVLEDNVAVEFNIPPASSAEDFVSSVTWALDELKAEVAKFKLSLCVSAAELFPPSQLRHPRSQIFGCDPDYNAWKNGEVNPKPKANAVTLRAAGGHIHFGYPEKVDERFRHRLIQSCDLHLGIPSVVMDSNTRRRELYGKAGAFRKTAYGAEYRTLSNFWLRSKETIRWAYQNAERAYQFALDPVNWMILDLEKDNIIGAINHSKVDKALVMCQEYQLALCT
jgi:phiEco32-like amidoligase-type 2 protein